MVSTSEALRYTEKHAPKVDGDTSHRCYAILSDGSICNRPCNFVSIFWLVPRSENDSRPPGHWRHNPRPYRNH